MTSPSDLPLPAPPAPAGSVQLDEHEWALLIDFLQQAPGRISVVLVPGPVVTRELLRRMQAAGLETTTLALDAPLRLAHSLAPMHARDLVVSFADLDTSTAFPSRADSAAFWQGLNLQREHLASDRLRLCLFVEPGEHAQLVREADDLRSWAREFSFLEALVPIATRDEPSLERRVTELPSSRQIETRRAQLRRAREVGLAENVLVRDYALPLFEDLVNAGHLREAEALWQHDLRSGAAGTSAEMHWRMRAFHADLLAAVGATADARDEYQAVLAWLEHEASQRPDDAAIRKDVAVAADRLGDMHLRVGQGDAARQFYEKALAIAERLARQEPNRTDFQRALSVSYNNLGELLLGLGQHDAARQFYEQALAIAERLARQEPDRADFQRDLSVSYNNLGELLLGLGRGDAARQFYEKALAIAERLARQEPDRADFQGDLSVSFERLGDLLLGLGQGDAARQFYEKALATRERLARQEPDRADFQRDLSVSYNKLGDLLRGLGQGEAARQFYEKALAIAERLAGQEPERADYQRDLAVSYERLGDLLQSLGQGEAARQLYDKDLAIAERLARQEPDRADLQVDLVASLARAGTEDPAHLNRALDILRALDSQGRLLPAQQAWIGQIEARLQAVPPQPMV